MNYSSRQQCPTRPYPRRISRKEQRLADCSSRSWPRRPLCSCPRSVCDSNLNSYGSTGISMALWGPTKNLAHHSCLPPVEPQAGQAIFILVGRILPVRDSWVSGSRKRIAGYIPVSVSISIVWPRSYFICIIRSHQVALLAAQLRPMVDPHLDLSGWGPHPPPKRRLVIIVGNKHQESDLPTKPEVC